MTEKMESGNWYAIKAPSGGYYLAELGCGGDFLFADQVFSQPAIPMSPVRHFLRLMVAYPSIRRAGWQHIGKTSPSDEAQKPGMYLQKPVGSEVLLYNIKPEQRRSLESQTKA